MNPADREIESHPPADDPPTGSPQSDLDHQVDDRGFRRWLTQKARRAGLAVVSRAFVLWYAARDPDTPAAAKAVLWGGLAYLAEPIDAIPDLTPLLGYTDDMALMGIALAAVTASIKSAHIERAEARAVELLGP